MELIKRMEIQFQQKDIKERRKVEQILKNCMSDQVKQLFPNLENDEAADVEDILIGNVVGRNICHMWYDIGTNNQEVYLGRLNGIKKCYVY